jgi:glutamyl-tRNA synthetase
MLKNKEQQTLLDAKTPYTIRLKIPDGRKVVFNDSIRGPIEYDSEILDDLVLMKSDGFPTYHLANVIDDHCMEISHVLRGDEWISSTPRHILIYEALGFTPPIFAHMPVILSSDGGKLSKRKGAASVMDYKRSGFLPEALFNFLAFLGWSPGEGDTREKMTQEDLIAAFSIDHISPKAAVFDEKKLEWMNGKYLEERSPRSLIGDVTALLKEKNIINDDHSIDEVYTEKVISLLKGRSKRITEIVDSGSYFFTDPTNYEEKAVKKYFNPPAADALQKAISAVSDLTIFSRAEIETAYNAFVKDQGITLGEIVHPTRLAISGVSFGPGLFELMEALGKEIVVRRMRNAIVMINKMAEIH